MKTDHHSSVKRMWGAAFILLAAIVLCFLFVPGLFPAVFQLTGRTETGGSEGTITVLYYGDTGMDGDAVLVESNGHYILMDTGYSDNKKDVGNSTVIKTLKSMGVHDLDLYLSHYHNDHYYLMTTIMKDDFFHVGTVYLPNIEKLLAFSSKENKDAKWYEDLTRNISIDGDEWGHYAYTKIQEAIEEKRIKQVRLHQGDTFRVGDALFEVLWQEEIDKKPDPDAPDAKHMINNTSLVTRVTIGGVRYLTAGDIYKSVEQNMMDAGLDLRADILKTDHHSNPKTSNLPAFYQAVDAAWAFGTGPASDVCTAATDLSGSNYVNLKNNGQITFRIDRGEITMSARRNLRRVNCRYTDAGGNTKTKSFMFDKDQQYYLRDRMFPAGSRDWSVTDR